MAAGHPGATAHPSWRSAVASSCGCVGHGSWKKRGPRPSSVTPRCAESSASASKNRVPGKSSSIPIDYGHGHQRLAPMLERVTGESWEDMIRERIFEPMGMTSAGFFARRPRWEKTDQPWGHLGEIGELRPVPPGPQADLPPAIGPAATVHASLAGFTRYADLAFRLEAGRAPRFSPKRLTIALHRPSARDPGLRHGLVDR